MKKIRTKDLVLFLASILTRLEQERRVLETISALRPDY